MILSFPNSRKVSISVVAAGTLVMAALMPAIVQARVTSAEVARDDSDHLTVSWHDVDPVDIYAGDRPDFRPDAKSAVVLASTVGTYVVDHAGTSRRYFILVDRRDHSRFEVAERVVPLAQGSNFRDIGGYVGAGGKRVRWGLIYRSAGQPLLTPADVAYVQSLGVGQLVDLRSSDERVIAPSRITGIPYTAVGYDMADLMKGAGGGPIRNGADLYHNFPHLLAPQLRIVFAHLLHQDTPIIYNCSAGQDRTGFVTAMVLTALGVDYDTIVADYHLSTQYRRPDYEMPPIDPALAASNPTAKLFLAMQKSPAARTPQPLKDADGRPFLRGAFDEITAKWGSVDAYLQQEAGVGPAEIARLRAKYLI